MIGTPNLYPAVGVEETGPSQPLESSEAIGHRISRVSQPGMEDFSSSLSEVSNRMEGSNNDFSSLKAEKSCTSELVQSPHHRIDTSEETGEWKSNKYFYDNSPLIRGNNDISAPQSEKSSTSELVQSFNHRIDTNEDTVEQKSGKYFYYDSPLYEDTGFWIPVSVPPMLESDPDEWSCGFGANGGYFPEEEFNWDQFLGEDKEMTMWDVVSEMFLVARGKVSALSSGNLLSHRMSWISTDILEETWKEMANTLAEANFGNSIEILETEPPKWLSDSAAAACMLCNIRFHPIMCSRHHCRFCGGIFCNDCSKGRSLLPRKFRDANPQRVCDVCCVRLESVQPYLMNQISHASQLPTHDMTDLSTLRSWLNFPWGRTMEYEIYKGANIVHSYCKVGLLKPEKLIPDVILKQAKGLAILTVVNVGIMVTYKVGTGLVLSRREDGTWSPPSAISSFGIGWGAQAGGELTDYIIVLRNEAAIKTFSSNGHLSIGAGLSAAAGIFGRAAEADIRAGDGGIAACYTYSCSKGAFVGCALNGSMVTTRVSENSRFYGAPIKASKILLGSMPRPPAAAILYRALSELFIKLES
ncbi:uncharacterized protein LOC122020569 [Zingiber officinale]|uniref:FYVE-type domain-containing protein n=1 Tax=Zingiber officinale TaxID=94328 RepID=A0A8J5LRN7_ZINOF|nr:uncharacterized protein LOC122020569 [Zingiber officinale]KAG6535829.1 hypothetical protein ZIOFF_000858 [Zingiber officinale]